MESISFLLALHWRSRNTDLTCWNSTIQPSRSLTAVSIIGEIDRNARRILLSRIKTHKTVITAANALILHTLWRSEIARGNGAERRSLGLRDDDDDDEGWLVSTMEGKTNFSRHLYRLSGTGIVECLKIIDVGSLSLCNLKQFDVEENRLKIENESHLCLYHRT